MNNLTIVYLVNKTISSSLIHNNYSFAKQTRTNFYVHRLFEDWPGPYFRSAYPVIACTIVVDARNLFDTMREKCSYFFFLVFSNQIQLAG
jgi:hypothetical protein